MNDQSKLDPRYDPAFQRGYSGEVRTAQHPHGVLRASQPTRQADRATASDAVPPAGVVAPPAEPAAPSTALPYEEIAEDEPVEQPVVEHATVRTLLRNPFLGILALLGAALAIAGGSWAISARSMMMDAGSFASERDYWFVQAALVGSPVLAMTGVAILAGVLFVFATAWNRSR